MTLPINMESPLCRETGPNQRVGIFQAYSCHCVSILTFPNSAYYIVQYLVKYTFNRLKINELH